MSSIPPTIMHRIDAAYTERAQRRLDELLTFCHNEYRIDLNVVRLVVSCVIPCQPVKPIWVLIETERHPFWDHLSKALKAIGLNWIINIRPIRTSSEWGTREVNERTNLLLEARDKRPQILIDTSLSSRYIRTKTLHLSHPYWTVAQECLRVRIDMPMMRLPGEKAEVELATLLKLVIDPNRRLFPNRVQLPDKIHSIVGTLNNLNPQFRMTSTIYEGLSLLVPAHAAMCGRDDVTDEDWRMIGYVLRGWIHPKYYDVFKWYVENYLIHARIKTQAGNGYARLRVMPTDFKLGGYLNRPTYKMALQLQTLARAGILKTYRFKTGRKGDWEKTFWKLGWYPSIEGEHLMKATFDDKFSWRNP